VREEAFDDSQTKSTVVVLERRLEKKGQILFGEIRADSEAWTYPKHNTAEDSEPLLTVFAYARRHTKRNCWSCEMMKPLAGEEAEGRHVPGVTEYCLHLDLKLPGLRG
jgi:hypothetical protein